MAIEYNFETDFKLEKTSDYTDWIISVVKNYQAFIGDLNYIFCSDSYLLEINKKYLNHDTLTDIITFDYTHGNELAADIYISIDRVKENAQIYEVLFEDELKRVMIHGILHLLGYTDTTDEDKSKMRKQEDKMIQMFHVEQ